MERQLSQVKKSLVSLVLALVLGCAGTLFAQTPSIIEHIRFSIWADVDAYPAQRLPQMMCRPENMIIL